MNKYLNKLVLSLLPLICFSNSSALAAPYTIPHMMNPVIQRYQPTLCNDNLMSTHKGQNYYDLISGQPTPANLLATQNINGALSILCFNNPYAPEIAKNVITIANPVVQKVQSNLSSSELIFNMNNQGNDLHKLILVKSPAAKQIQLQYTIKDKSGALVDQQIKQIPINVSQKLILSDAGYRIMMLNFNPRLRARDQVPLTLVFEDGSKMKINAQVQCENFYQ